MLRVFTLIGAIGGWLSLLVLVHVMRATSPGYVLWLLAQ